VEGGKFLGREFLLDTTLFLRDGLSRCNDRGWLKRLPLERCPRQIGNLFVNFWQSVRDAYFSGARVKNA
jgi:hypothetical protein